MTVQVQESDEPQPGSVVVSTEPNLPFVWVDRDRMRRVLYNVIGNALKYSRDGLAGPQIAVQMTSTSTTVVMTITDNGKGIAPEQLQRIGERFHQVARNRAGMGVGLSFCIRIIQQVVAMYPLTQRAKTREQPSLSTFHEAPHPQQRRKQARMGAVYSAATWRTTP